MKYGKPFSKFIKEKYPNYKPMSPGDPRTASVEGGDEVLSENGFIEASVREITMTFEGPPNQVVAFFENMYNVSLLPQTMRAEFLAQLSQLASEECINWGEMSFDFPMILFSSVKPK